MKALVVYDSVFGNTEQIARAIGDALGAGGEAHAVRVGDVKPEHLAGLDVLLVGSPTRAFSATPAVKKWLKGLKPNSLRGIKVAAFDTRVDVKEVNSRILTGFTKVFGYAAEPIGEQLVKKGGTRAILPEGFIVEGTEGPLRDGELERAAAWARQI
ncbi:MAG: flavodoxin family protein [Thermoflexales bacterium]|nr:flavodoxin family protein [Thermoflexales bacterium]